MRAEGIILLYHFEPPYAATVMDHVTAFQRYSRFEVWPVNVAHGYPSALDLIDPAVILLHYSLFGSSAYFLDDNFLGFLDRATDAHRVAFFQDEYYYCPQRFEFIDDHRIDCVYTLLDPLYHDRVYHRFASVPRLIHTIPGFVSDDLVALARGLGRPDDRRAIDIGYRARRLPYYMGRGAQEKWEIGERFRELAADRGLCLDIETEESDRLYGRDWYEFLADCRGVLGVEAGVSIFDLDDSVRLGYERLISEDPSMSFDEMSKRLLEPFEDKIPYRTVSPRHFEAAAFRVTQILFEGRYSGILEPMRHYIPLRKDFSNLDEVLRLFADPDLRRTIASAAYEDLIESGRYSYRRFVAAFDADLESAGAAPPDRVSGDDKIRILIRRGERLRRLRADTRGAVRRARDSGIARRFRGR